MGNYILEADVDNWPSGMNINEKAEIVEQAEDQIERLTHDYFYAKVLDKHFDGNDGDELNLGLMPDILSVTQVFILGVELDSSWWTHGTDSIYFDPEVTMGDSELPQTLFPKGVRNVRVVGTYGWTQCPVAIKKAAVILCRVENDPTLYSHYNDFTSEKLGDYSMALSTGKFVSGITEVDKLIRQYIRKKPMMGAA